MDVTSFEVGNAAVVEAAVALAREAQAARQFTDTSKFALRCLVCQQGLIGQEDAVKHATETGHQNFSEY
jgi:ubiquitin thioesterase OTU1|eukprot:COSAG02_NODE_1173_length_14105_cov_15.197701_4_plen_69_part_00